MSFTRLIYLLLAFVIAWCGYYLLTPKQDNRAQIAPNLELPMFSGNELENITYGKDGVRSYVIHSAHLEHYAKSGDTKFEQPTLTIYRQGIAVEWVVSASKAILSKDKILTLHGHVLMQNQLPGSSFNTMSTDKLTIDLTTHDFKADQKVVLVGPQFNTTGGAMKGNLKTHIAALTNHVQGRYETITP